MWTRGLFLTAFLAAPAHADGRYDGADWAWSTGAGAAGALVGAAAVTGVGVALTEDGAGFESLGAVIVGLPLGSLIGGTAGAWLYGDLSGHETRWWAPILGGLVGSGVGFAGFLGATQLDSDFALVLGMGSLLLMPALGATTGYALGLEGEPAAKDAPRLTVAPVPTRGGWAGVVGLQF